MNKYNPYIHHRHSVRLRHYDYSRIGLYFLTLCTHKRLPLFGKIANRNMCLNDIGTIAQKCWDNIQLHFPDVVLHENVIMPNHIHGIIEIAKSSDIANVGVENFQPLRLPQRNEFQHVIPRSIGSIIRGFKIGTTKQIGYSVWQRNYHEHIIRNENDYSKIATYINNNPVQWHNDRFYCNVEDVG